MYRIWLDWIQFLMRFWVVNVKGSWHLEGKVRTTDKSIVIKGIMIMIIGLLAWGKRGLGMEMELCTWRNSKGNLRKILLNEAFPWNWVLSIILLYFDCRLIDPGKWERNQMVFVDIIPVFDAFMIHLWRCEGAALDFLEWGYWELRAEEWIIRDRSCLKGNI